MAALSTLIASHHYRHHPAVTHPGQGFERASAASQREHGRCAHRQRGKHGG
jgi:hypothetical protein